jgi:hypothetical protein
MANTATSWVEIDLMIFGKLLDLAVFFKILLTLILNIMVESKDWLAWVVEFGCTNRFESVYS